MRPTSPARLWHVILAAAVAVLTIGAPAPAQQTDWKGLVEKLASPEPEVVKASRTELIARLTEIGFSVADRSGASTAMMPGLQAHVAAGGDPALQALIVAGDVATEAAADLLDGARANAASDVRYAAVYGFGRAFDRINTAAPAINNAKAQWMISRLGEGLATEPQAEVADAYVRALIAASRVNQQNLGDLHVPALRALARSMSTRVATLKRTPDDDPFRFALIRAAEEVRNAITADALQKQLPQEFVCEAAAFAGDMLAYLYHRVRAGEAGGWAAVAPEDGQEVIEAKTAARRPAATLAQVSEAIVVFIKDRHQVGRVGQFGLAGMIQSATPAGDRQFLDPAVGEENKGVLGIIGPGGLLTKFNCAFAPDRFLRGG